VNVTPAGGSGTRQFPRPPRAGPAGRGWPGDRPRHLQV